MDTLKIIGENGTVVNFPTMVTNMISSVVWIEEKNAWIVEYTNEQNVKEINENGGES